MLTRKSGVLHQFRVLRGPTGKIVFGTGTDDVARLAADVERGVFAHVLERAERDLAEGRSVTFGAFSVEEKGLRHGDRFLLWRAVDDAVFDFGRFTVRRRDASGPWAEVEIGDIPNAPVFLLLVQRFAADPPSGVAGTG